MRLYKYIKVFANMTQHEVSEAFDNKRIKVNGEIQNFTYIVKENDVVSLDDKIISALPFKYFLYYNNNYNLDYQENNLLIHDFHKLI